MCNLVILCGGVASRLGDECLKIPKILLKINNTVFLDMIIKKYQKIGITNFYFITGHLGKEILKYLVVLKKKYPKLIFYYFYEGNYRLGTGGALKKFIPKLPDSFLLTYGDSYPNISKKLIKNLTSIKKKFGIKMLVFKNNDKFDISNISLNTLTGSIKAYDKINAGSYEYIDSGLIFFYGLKKIFKNFSNKNKFDLIEVIKHLIKINKAKAVITKNRFYEIGSIKGINDLDQYLKKK